MLAWLFFYWSIAQVIESAIIAQGKVRWLFGYDFFSLACTIAGLTWAVIDDMTLFQLALVRVVTGSSAMIILLLAAFRQRLRLLLPLCALVGILTSVLVVSFLLVHYFAAPLLASKTYSFVQFLMLGTLGTLAIVIYALACLAMCKWLRNVHVVRLVNMLPQKIKVLLG